MNAPKSLFAIPQAPHLNSYPKYWAECFGRAPFLPMSRNEMDQLGWDSCDIILVTGDAYVDHPSFGMAIIGRLLESQGFRVGIISQPTWQNAEPFKTLGKPNLYFGVTAGNMDSMINGYTADRKIRKDDAYTAGGMGGKRPDRCSLVYAQRCQEAFPEVPIIMGGIEASLRRIAHYDYWQDKVRRSILIDAKADILLYGNAERALVEISHRLARGEKIRDIQDVRGTAFVRRKPATDFLEIDSTQVDAPGKIDPPVNPYLMPDEQAAAQGESCAKANPDETSQKPSSTQVVQIHLSTKKRLDRDRTVIRLPSYEAVKRDAVLYAHASRILHLETNPGNARALVQQHGIGPSTRDVWLTPPPIPLTTEEMDFVFDQPYARAPHPSYGDAKIPAWEMIRFSVNIMRGCFGGCTFCSITEHEGRIIQNRSANSIIKEIEDIRDKVPGFTGVISDLGGPTANMYRIACKSKEIEAHCRKPSCVYPDVCPNLNTDHTPLIQLYRRARGLPGVKKILISSGLRYDLAVKAPAYIKELVTHHVGGYLKIAPEHTEGGPLSKMMKPGIGSYNKFKELFDKYSKEAGKEQYLIPYFIAAHPGTSDEDMMHLAIWLKQNNFRADQVQTFYPSPMATATAMYHTNKNPLRKVTQDSESVDIVRGEKRRRLHKAFLRYHDANNWPLLRDALKKMGRADLIGNGKHHLIPSYQPQTDGSYQSSRKKNSSQPLGSAKVVLRTRSQIAPNPRDFTIPEKVKTKNTAQPTRGRILTQHTGLPPRSMRSSKSIKTAK
ncbi:MAG: YgiQ family radical SAM protein [Betaproteobacteria bacterium]